MTRTISKVAVCGAGAMGTGIAQVAAQAGASVKIFDVQSAALVASERRMRTAIEQLVERGRLSAHHAAAVLERCDWTDALDTIADADLVIEAIVEDVDVKGDLFSRIESVVGPTAIIASNTSSLPISRLARALRGPERFVGMHFFNPAPAMKLVEIVPGAATTIEVAESVRAVAAGWGKVAITVADVPGFIVNRVARPFYAEAFTALNEGASADAIDALVRGAGFRMGPLELADLIGHDVNFVVARSVHAGYFGRARFVPQIRQAALVDAGWLGRKTGRGVYRYDQGNTVAPSVPARSVPSDAGRVAAAEFSVGGGDIRVMCDGVAVGYTRGVTARGEASSRGGPVALLDWFATDGAGPVGFAASDASAARVATDLISALDRDATQLPDRPGMIVMRTLSQILNAAADAVFEQVSDEAGVDTALRYGANYPFGPFAWADRVGRHAVVEFLTGLAEATGEPMYHPSPYLRQTA